MNIFFVSKLKGSAESLKSKTPDLLSFTFTGLKDIGEEYGVNSDQVKDATKFLTKHLDVVRDCLKMFFPIENDKSIFFSHFIFLYATRSCVETGNVFNIEM